MNRLMYRMERGDMIKRLLVSLLAFFVPLEIGLRIFDPIGIMAFHRTLYALVAISEDHANLYALTEGEHDFGAWSMTVGESGYRVSGHPGNDCTIAILGDSITMGWRVNDDEVWVSQIETDVTLIDTAVYGYNITNIRRAMEYTPADAYLYYWTRNDMVSLFMPANQRGRFVPAVGVYTFYLARRYIQALNPTVALAAFEFDLTTLQQHDNLVIVGDANDDTYHWLMDTYDVDGIALPETWETISMADAHPTVAGHRTIAREMQAIIDGMEREFCR